MNIDVSRNQVSKQRLLTNVALVIKWVKKNYFIPATLSSSSDYLDRICFLSHIIFILFSFFSTKLLSTTEFVGLKHYISVLNDKLFIKSLSNTVIYSVGAIAGTVVLGLAIALILDSPLRGKDFFRTVFFIPYIIPFAAHTLLWYWLYDPRYGLVNYLLGFLGISPIPWLTSTNWVIPCFLF